MTKIQDKLQMMYIDNHKHIHEKTFFDKAEANKAFTVLNNKHLPIATKKGMNSTRLWNSTKEDWLSALLKRLDDMWWQYSIGYELLSELWGMNAVSIPVDKNLCSVITEIWGIEFDNNDDDYVIKEAWEITFDNEPLLVTESIVTARDDSMSQKFPNGEKYIELAIYSGNERASALCRPIID